MAQNAKTRPGHAGSESSPIDVSPALPPHKGPRSCDFLRGFTHRSKKRDDFWMMVVQGSL